ncbi:MAG TPA: DinB family protein [Gemmatimonadales bacterium]|nr:DinB family protein [Gemmatimonadales bacterium]
MRLFPVVALAALLTAVPTAPAAAQGSNTALADLMSDVAEVEQKLVGLARAMPAESFAWRPAAGVRSVGEVFQHVAADNYLLPVFAGTSAPAATGIVGDQYATVQAYETRSADRATVIADLEQSFAHLRAAMTASATRSPADTVTLFGQKRTLQQLWVLTTTHLHEHLGQAIAYARSNNVVPPWSR